VGRGLSNEEFASKLRAIRIRSPRSTRRERRDLSRQSKAVETRSPVNAFVPYTLNNQQHLIAGYTCTPLVKFPIADLKAGEKVRGTTIAEFGAGNRVLDMIVYKKAAGVPAHREQQPRRDEDSDGAVRVRQADHDAGRIRDGGVPFEKVTSMMGVEQLDKLDDTTAIVISRSAPAASISRPCRCRSEAPRLLRLAAVTASLVTAAACGRSVNPRQSGDQADQPAERPRLRRGHGTARGARRPRTASLTNEQWSALLASPSMTPRRDARRLQRRRRRAAVHPRSRSTRPSVSGAIRSRASSWRAGPPRRSSPRWTAGAGCHAFNRRDARLSDGDVVPENLLRMYIEFSEPMGSRAASST
jgi:hypothetical protein